jgi:hypothetical protein
MVVIEALGDCVQHRSPVDGNLHWALGCYWIRTEYLAAIARCVKYLYIELEPQSGRSTLVILPSFSLTCSCEKSFESWSLSLFDQQTWPSYVWQIISLFLENWHLLDCYVSQSSTSVWNWCDKSAKVRRSPWRSALVKGPRGWSFADGEYN